MAPAGCSEEELLAELVNSANLVQGCWVCASHVRPQYRPIRAQRDYILLLFSRNRVVKYEQLRGLPLNKETLRDLMVPLAVQRAGVGWEFKVGYQMNLFIFLKHMWFLWLIYLKLRYFKIKIKPFITPKLYSAFLFFEYMFMEQVNGTLFLA